MPRPAKRKMPTALLPRQPHRHRQHQKATGQVDHLLLRYQEMLVLQQEAEDEVMTATSEYEESMAAVLNLASPHKTPPRPPAAPTSPSPSPEGTPPGRPPPPAAAGTNCRAALHRAGHGRAQWRQAPRGGPCRRPPAARRACRPRRPPPRPAPPRHRPRRARGAAAPGRVGGGYRRTWPAPRRPWAARQARRRVGYRSRTMCTRLPWMP